MGNEDQNPDDRNFAPAEREQARSGRREVNCNATDSIGCLSCLQKEKPPGTRKNKCETIGASRNVIDRRTVNRMYRPKQSDQESGMRNPRDAFERHLPNWLRRPGEAKGENKLSQEQIDQNATC